MADSYKAFINAAAAQLGVDPSIVETHTRLETSAGGAKAIGQFNYGNIKAGSSWAGATVGMTVPEVKGGKTVSEAAKFRAYGTPEEAATDYASLLRRRYPGAAGAKTAGDFVGALVKGGYATDPDYQAKFLGTASKHTPAGTRIAGPEAPGIVPEYGVPARAADPLTEVMPGRATYANGAADGAGGAALPVLPEPRAIAGTDQVAETQAQSVLDQAEAEKGRVPVLEQMRRSSASSGIMGAATRLLAARDILGDNVPDPKFKLDPEKLKGTDSTELEYLSEAVNAKDLEHRLWAVEDRRESQKIVAARGVGYELLAGTVSELPTSALLGIGVASAAGRLGMGSARLLAAGRPGAAAGYNVAENAVANAAAEGIQERIDPFHTWKDAAFNMTAGALFDAALGSPTLIREGVAHRRLMAAGEAHGEQRLAAQQAAEVAVGADAPAAHRVVQQRELQETQAQRMQIEIESPQRVLAEDVALSTGYVVREQEVGGDLGEWVRPGNWQQRAQNFQPGGVWEDVLASRTGGLVRTFDDMQALAPGVHATPDVPERMVQAVRAARQVGTKFFGEDFRIVLAPLNEQGTRGRVVSVSDNSAVINIDPTMPEAQMIRTTIHEIGHMVWHKHVSKLSPDIMQAVDTAYQRFRTAWSANVDGGKLAREQRFSLLSPEREGGKLPFKEYVMDRDEFSAEQFVKYIEDDVRSQGKIVDRQVSEILRSAIKAVIDFILNSGRKVLGVEQEYKAFFDDILAGVPAAAPTAQAVTPARKTLTLKKPAQADKARSGWLRRWWDSATQRLDSADAEVSDGPMSVDEIQADQDIQRLGLHLFPMDTPQARAEVLAIKELYRKAETSNIQVDESRLSKLLDTAVFEDGQSRANVLLRSKNPVARFVAATLAESPSGAAGRRKTAAISKSLHEQAFLGNSMNEVQAAYRLYRQEAGGSVVEDTWGGKHWEEFNTAVAREIEARGRGAQVNSHTQVRKAADSLEAAYERMRSAQVQANTVGAGSLPSTSRGYMPHRLSQEKIRNAGTKELSALHTALTDQFVADLGFDMSFADMLASKYIDRVKIRALGGADTPAGMAHAGASDVVEEALRAAGMGDAEVKATLQRIAKAGPGHTKKRLQLDLNRTYDTPDGGTFRLGDLFESDQFTLLRAQASRVSGEVALMEHGVPGKAGLDMIRRALRAGEDGQQATLREVDAFDQIAAEFLGAPYGTQSKVIDRVLQANSLVRLGGLAWTQLAETINGAVHLGVGKAFDSVVGIPRLIGEVRALARGEKVDGVLAGMEKLYGAEFGTLSYKTVFAFDNRSMDPHSYGQDTLTLMDRLLRGGGHLQGKLSMWRAIHSAQHRGMAEQIARKAVVYLQEGKSADVFLRDMGMSDDLLAKLRADLPRMASFDGSGRLLDLDVTKATDLDAAREFTQAVHRGVSQIIQGTFIGERSKWATDAHMRLLTQFRTFSLTSVEKQWGRQVGNVGPYKALGILIGTMSAAFPIYAARTYANSVGREDREEYLDKAFQPERIARQLMNYGAAWGLAPDFIDAMGALGGWNLGGRSGDQEQDFVGNVVAPGAGLINDVYRAVQNTEEGADVKQFMEAMPFNNLPFLVPLINGLGD